MCALFLNVGRAADAVTLVILEHMLETINRVNFLISYSTRDCDTQHYKRSGEVQTLKAASANVWRYLPQKRTSGCYGGKLLFDQYKMSPYLFPHSAKKWETDNASQRVTKPAPTYLLYWWCTCQWDEPMHLYWFPMSSRDDCTLFTSAWQILKLFAKFMFCPRHICEYCKTSCPALFTCTSKIQ